MFNVLNRVKRRIGRELAKLWVATINVERRFLTNTTVTSESVESDSESVRKWSFDNAADVLTGVGGLDALPGTLDTLTTATGLEYQTVYTVLARMVKTNRIVRVRRGYYDKA